MPFVIWGRKAVAEKGDAGTFACPQCRLERPYREIRTRSYFTLYYIPLFPMGNGEHSVRCDHCSTDYDLAVLQETAPSPVVEAPPPMDLFATLVRLDAAGWTTLPANPEEADGKQPELARLMRRAGGLEKGEQRFVFPSDHPVPDTLAPAAPVRFSLSATHAVVGTPERLWVVEHAGDPRTLKVLASSLAGWLASLFEPVDLGLAPPEALDALGLDGAGWGWSARLLDLPVALDVEGLPSELQTEPLQVDADWMWVGERVQGRVEDLATGAVDGVDGPDLDELFGAGGGRPRPRSALIGTLVAVGLFLAVIGMACISAPGGILVLTAWMFVEKDLDRLDNGYLPESDRELVETLRSVTYASLLLVVVLFVLQGLLLCNGFYDFLLDQVYIPWWRSLFQAVEPSL